MEQTGVRIFLLSMFCGVLYVFGSLAVLVLTAKTFCDHRTVALVYALLGFLLTGLTAYVAYRQRDGSRLIFMLPGTFFLLGTGIPTWLFLHAAKVCAAHG
ncbi:MAG: hypothetical protein ACRYF4_01645 [Janthinobacterium lividum]